MRRIKVGITLSEKTLEKLEEICEMNDLNKSQAISMFINSFYIEKIQEKHLKEKV